MLNAWPGKKRAVDFHALYDRLAFPGGISEAMASLAKSDTNTTEMVVRFLEADPWYFRSGYHKADMLKELRRVALEDGQRKRLQQVIISRIQDRETPREFRWYCRLAPYVSDTDFERHISEVAKSADSIQSRHAAWVLERLKSSPKQPTRKKH